MQVRIGGERVVTLGTIRGSVRPVLISGSRSQVQRSIKAAGPYIESLRDRGISVIPLPTSEDEPGDKLAALKAEFRLVVVLPSVAQSRLLMSLICTADLMELIHWSFSGCLHHDSLAA